MELWLGALNLGLLYAFLAVGVYITARILDFPDITVDGSFTTGAAVAAVLIINGIHPILTIFIAFLAGSICGMATGLIHTKLKINSLLAGILVMIGLYSVNLHIMGKSNIPLMNTTTLFTKFDSINPGLHSEIWNGIMAVCLILVFWGIISYFFKTDLGITLRATGDNPTMISANGINIDKMKIFGVALANGLVAVSGSIVAQYQGFADIGMGIGTLVIGLASVIIGEAIIRKRSITIKVFSAIIGAVIFRYMIAFALFVGMNPIDLKLITALFVLFTIVLSKINLSPRKKKNKMQLKKILKYSLTIIASIVIIFLGSNYIKNNILTNKEMMKKSKESDFKKIGIVQINRNGILDRTREAFITEMKRIGYDNSYFDFQSADGDIANLNNILDKFVSSDYDMILTISTPATQAALNKVKKIPVVFATVANPFVFGAGKTETDHEENITGTYGWVSMEKLVDLSMKYLPKKTIIGTIGNPGEANTEFYLKSLRKKIESEPQLTLKEQAVTSPNEVYEACLSLINKGVEVFILPVDNLIYSSFDSIIKAAHKKNIPVFSSDPTKLKNGAFLAYGYDYASSGVQAAHISKKVLQGTSPAAIPFERYEKLRFGINLLEADKMNIDLPENTESKFSEYVNRNGKYIVKKPKVGLVNFSRHPLFQKVQNGVLDAFGDHGYADGTNIDFDIKDANGDFQMVTSITQDFLRQDVDVIIPLSTPCLQSAINLTRKKKTPVIFSFVSDPYTIGVGKDSLDHLSNVSGYTCFPPFEDILKATRAIFPEKKTIGLVRNPAEKNSEIATEKIKRYAPRYGFEIIETVATTSAEVMDASKLLVVKDVEIFINPGDNTLNSAFDSYVKVATDNSIPVITDNKPNVKQGALLGLGADFYMNGYHSGEYAIKVLNGESPAKLPIRPTKEISITVNKDVADRFNWKIPNSILEKAEIISDNNRNKKEKSRQIAIFHFNDQKNSIESVEGILEALEKDDFANQNNLEIDVMSAQSEFSIAQSIVQDIVRKEYDYLITVSTPALQAGINFNKKIPHIFGTVTDPYLVGAAQSPTQHRDNLTGLQTFQPVASTIRLMREIFPEAKTIGIVWNSSEICSQACLEKAREAAEKYNFELIESTANTSIEVIDAVKALVDKVDIFFTSGDNLVELSVEPIAEIMQKNNIPYFTNSPSHIKYNTFLSIGADYKEVGVQTGKLAKKVISGANPQKIPIENYAPEKIAINLTLADKYKISIPKTILEKATIKFRSKQ